MTTRSTIPWSSGRWTHPPEQAVVEGGDLVVTAREGSDAWRHTSYGFVHESEHALLAPLAVGRAVEVAVAVDMAEQFDQAGVFVRLGPPGTVDAWVKAGLEQADGVVQLGAVVTLGRSDWSVAPVPGWTGRTATVRVSRAAESLTVRARVDDEPFALVRVCPAPEGVEVAAGPFTCAPSRPGWTARFRSWTETEADAALH